MQSSPHGFGVYEVDLEPFMKVVRLDTNAIVPERAHMGDAGLDVFNCENVAILAQSDKVIRTGISIAIPNGWVAVVKEKSGRATKNKLTVGACVIDAGYRGEVLIHLFNNSDIPVTFNIGEKIAQLVVVPCWTGQPEEVNILEDTERGEGRFGSTGLKNEDYPPAYQEPDTDDPASLNDLRDISNRHKDVYSMYRPIEHLAPKRRRNPDTGFWEDTPRGRKPETRDEDEFSKFIALYKLRTAYEVELNKKPETRDDW